MKDWKYPLTNLGHKGNQRRGPLTPTAIVRGADGCVLLSFRGLPDRSNYEAVKMATDFCAAMNTAHNSAALHETVEDLLYMAKRYAEKTPATEVIVFDHGTIGGAKTIDYRETIAKAEAALSAPPRNCDVGTAEEQSVRFDAFVQDRRGDLNCTGKCPAHNGVDFGVVDCVLQWAQMPYDTCNKPAPAPGAAPLAARPAQKGAAK